MSETKPARPPQVTVAGWLVVGGSVLVVLMAFDDVAQVRSLDTREAIEAFLAQPPGDALGLTVQGAQQVIRVAGMVAAACAAAAAILGWQALQRSKGARLALSALAAPILLTGFVSGGFASAMVVAATVMLWFQPARDWFEGRSPRPVLAPAAPSPVAAARDPLLDLPPPSAPPLYPTPSGAAPVRVAPEVRPMAVRLACVLTWFVSGLVACVAATALVAMIADPDVLLDELGSRRAELADQGVSEAAVRALGYVVVSVMLVWSAVAVALAALTWRRVRWAAYALAVSAGAAAGACLLMLVGSALAGAPLAAAAASLALLLRPESRAWLFRR